MKSALASFFISFLLTIILTSACDKVNIEVTPPDPPERGKDGKPDFPAQPGSIRGCFGHDYRIFIHHTEKAQPADSYSNCYF
jgi:hypothetical protein